MLLEKRKKFELRGYQQNAINGAREIITRGKFPILVAPTGAGKSAIAINIAMLCVEKGLRCLIIAPLEPLINQFYQTCCDWLPHRLLEKVGILAGTRPVRPMFIHEDRGIDKNKLLGQCNLLIAMAQTIESRKWLPFAPNVVLWDEGHLSYFREECKSIVNKFSPSAQHVPMTATPWRLDGQTFSHKFELFQVCTTKWLIEEGFLTPYKAFNLCKFVIKDKRKKQRDKQDDADYTLKELNQIVEVATPQKVWEEWNREPYKDKHTIAFVPSKKVGEMYAEYFRSQGKECEVITDKTSPKQREAIYKRFREEKIVLFSITVLAVGFDQPCACVALLLRATKSLALLIQMIGRVLRKFAGKTLSYLLDFTGTITKPDMPLPDEITDWNDIPVNRGRECPDCGAINGATAVSCKECGCELPKQKREEVKEQDLDEVITELKYEEVLDALALRFNQIQDQRQMIEVRSLANATPEEEYKVLRQRAFLSNYSPGQAFYKFKEKYKRHPEKGWGVGAIFGTSPTFTDKCLYYGYLLSHQKNKPVSWVQTEMKAEFGLEHEIEKVTQFFAVSQELVTA